MNLFVFDFETVRLVPGCNTPPAVCLSWMWIVAPPAVSTPEATAFAQEAKLSHCNEKMFGSEAFDAITDALADSDTLLVGKNTAFDLSIYLRHRPDQIGAVFQAYADNRIICVEVREKLLALATGRLHYNAKIKRVPSFGLAEMVLHYFDADISAGKGPDAWRLRYHELIDTPLHRWPVAASDYPKSDVLWTLACYLAQPTSVTNEHEQVKAAWALQLMSNWGVRTDPWAVTQLKEDLEQAYDILREHAMHSGLLNVTKANLKKQKWTKCNAAIRDAVKLVYEKSGMQAPVVKPKKLSAKESAEETISSLASKILKPPAISMERDVLVGAKDVVLSRFGSMEAAGKELARTAEALSKLGELTKVEKLLGTYVPVLESGTRHPIHCYYDVLKETGRTSASRPNVQNLPRGGDKLFEKMPSLGDPRRCFTARDGWVYVSVDYATLELRALAQTCLDLFGYSRMADALRSGQDDLHSVFAAKIVGVSYDEFIKVLKDENHPKNKEYDTTRGSAKVANFGFPGGLGAATFVEYARKGYKVILTEERAKTLKAEWLEAFPEMKDYFKHVSNLMGGFRSRDKYAKITQPRSNRVRGRATYTAACNQYFQGCAADGAKNALWQTAFSCYVDHRSPLYGCRPVLFIHDEIIVEVPPWVDLHEASYHLAEIMCQAMSVYIPNIPVKAEPVAMTHWYKNAKLVKDGKGRLIPWYPPQPKGAGNISEVAPGMVADLTSAIDRLTSVIEALDKGADSAGILAAAPEQMLDTEDFQSGAAEAI